MATQTETNATVSTSEKTLHQQKALEDFIARYTQRTKTSKQLTQTYRPVLADNKNLGEFHSRFKELYYPIVGKRSLGSRIWDVDDNEYHRHNILSQDIPLVGWASCPS